MEDKKPLSSDISRLMTAQQRLRDQLFLQTGTMFRYCGHMGINIPAEMLERFDRIFAQWIVQRQNDDAGHRREDDEGLVQVAEIHNALSLKVAPANPRSIQMIEEEMAPVAFWRYLLGFRFLGPVKIVRALMGVAVLALLLFLGLSLSSYLNAENMAKNLFELDGIVLAYNLLFLLSAAALGAAFAGLFELRAYVTRRTYDSVYATDYWIKFFLGLISGLTLAELIPIDELLGAESVMLSRPLLAMLGGFSVQAVYQLLKRFVQTLETIVQGKPKADSDSRQIALKDQAHHQLQQYRAQYLAELGNVQKMIASGENGDVLREEVDRIFKRAVSNKEPH